MTTDADLIMELREIHCGEAANRLEQLVISNRALSESLREKMKRILDRVFGPVA